MFLCLGSAVAPIIEEKFASLLDKFYDQTAWIAKASSLVFWKLCECAFGDCPSSSKNEPKIQSYS